MKFEISGHNLAATEFEQAPAIIRRAMVSSLNRGIKAGESYMVKRVAGDIGIAQKDVRKATRSDKATATRPAARLAASLKRIPLERFKARGPYPSRGRGNGVSYTLNGSRGRIPSGFLAVMKAGANGGHRGVFTRAGRKSSRNPSREAIVEKFGPSIGHVFAKYRADGKARAYDAFLANFDREVAYRVAKAGGA